MNTALPTHVSEARPWWLLLVIALPAVSAMNSVMPYPERLYQAILLLTGGLHDPSALQRYAAGMTCKLLLPTLLAVSVLRFSRLGSWLAPNRLAVGCLAGASGILLLVSMRGLYQAAQGEPHFLSGELSEVLTPIVLTLLSAGLAALLSSTIWHRLVSDKARMQRLAWGLWREL